MIINKQTLDKLSRKLNFPFDGSQQDWAVEYADSKRLKEFIEFASSEALSSAEAYSIMALILASYDQYLSENLRDKSNLWLEIVSIIDRNPKLYSDLLKYWALGNDIDHFEITPLVRKYLTCKQH
ncbi:hypothetical protein KHS38_05315 [Mucilaginibacter sp. Bleaf8]|uniref:hypothetical protein n=1 Tax=Mucilaginibacter sp. Bleaf8 TaxID=2834430 RepID=UPI001BD1479C|nr:hypothetical protein [Mucilaginibacter sp. Bleaf8]MBS7563815.1 hypothetical protein [Mucilaginibacter sp. Bleaf8]